MEAWATLTSDPMPVEVGDPLQLEQVFAKRVTNAITFRRPDTPHRVHIGPRQTDGSWELFVADRAIRTEPYLIDRGS